MPTTVFLIGIFSIILLLWVDRISEKLRTDSDIVDAIMDVQIHTATAHLWLEHAVGGDTEADAEKVIADLDPAINLVDVTLKGGKSEHNWISEPLEDPELRARAEAIKSLLVKFKMIGLARLQDPEKSGIGSVSHHQSDTLFKEILSKARNLEDVIERDEARNREKYRLLFLGILVSWVFIVVAATAGLWSRERQRKSAEEALRKAHEQLLSQAEELTGHREHLAKLVEKRTAELTTANELLRVEITERRQTEETLKETEQQIRLLSSRLITAQEMERKRISMELHDELGQALSVTKLRIRAIEKGLSEGQPEIREECEALLGYMDHVIEDVRRLSLALSPTILEDLGLTSALRWLVSSFAIIPATILTADIAEIDHLFPRSHWITIYRVIQEALTNIGKHAEAEHVSVVVRRHDDTVIFSVEDNGKGFDLKQASVKNAPEKGLGLATMTERVRMMDGVFDLWSQTGKGTRITFSIPVGKGGA
ncbi:sensor histidine kinase [Geobacter sp.]|uniref:sensor histidine kinase n=1 Tax=Geobacter sp. TaxID=46610 RepID=UPI001AD4BAF7|nr:sensor histidine kinase [Geobacter sp.]CAG1016387.1 two-component system, NarL family, sensor histidine kinase UhpB [Anaerolineales bacterium]